MKLTADKILPVAAESQRVGRTFYESLTRGCGHAENAILVPSLVNDEKEHIDTFERMKNALPPHQRCLKLTVAGLITADDELCKQIIPNGQDVYRTIQTKDHLKTPDISIEMEPDVMAFFSALDSDVSNMDKAVISGIVSDEKTHLSKLRETRIQLSQANV